MIATDLVAFKGSRNGILVSMRDDCDFVQALQQFEERVGEQPSFFKGSPMSLDLGWRELKDSEWESLTSLVHEHGMRLLGVISSSLHTRRMLEGRGIKVIIGRLGLAQHQGRAIKDGKVPEIVKPAPVAPPVPTPEVVVAEPVADAPVVAGAEAAIVVRRTLRSGQRVDFDGNVIIVGDVNAGAHVEASGDVIVMGALRGTAHAGARGRSASTIYAHTMQAAQVRIAGIVGELPTKSQRQALCLQARLLSDKVIFDQLR
ncbi:MAG: septum site-determining protein MinC [Candidatus Xenobia bacterium]